MTIELLYFAQIREAFGSGGETLEVSDTSTVDEVVSLLRKRDRWQQVSRLPLSFAVNEKIVNGDFSLKSGDRLALLTPVAGG